MYMDRKEVVLKLSEFLGVEHNYLGAPSFAYEIAAAEETYTVDRQGTITTSAGKEITLEEILNPEQPEEETEAWREVETPENETEAEQEAETPEAESPEADTHEEPEAPAIGGLELELSLEDHTGITLRNIVNMLTSKQNLIMKAFELPGELLDAAFAEEFISKHGSILKTSSGYIQQIPQVSIAQQNLKQMRNFCSELGLTPSARSRLNITNAGGIIEKFIERLGAQYNIREIVYDRWGATQMSQNLEGMGFTVVPFGQGFKDMSPPTKELMRLTLNTGNHQGPHQGKGCLANSLWRQQQQQ
jgi:P27 family predicted phage terminase small subunit